MKHLVLICLIFSTSCQKVSNSDEKMARVIYLDQNIECSIYPQTGLDQIEINKSSLTDAMGKFGETKIRKEWQKAIEFQLFGHFTYKLDYPELGLKFNAINKNKMKIINSIELGENCNCETLNGISIGSEYAEIVSAFGQPLFNGSTPNPRYEPTMHYEGTSKKLIMRYQNMMIEFDNQDTLFAKINKIKMY